MAQTWDVDNIGHLVNEHVTPWQSHHARADTNGSVKRQADRTIAKKLRRASLFPSQGIIDIRAAVCLVSGIDCLTDQGALPPDAEA
jgi:hypothetical protein